MSLIVSPSTHTSAVPVAQAGAFGGAASPSLKWLWVAIGVLGVSVVALGTTLVVQNAGKSAAADAQPLAMTAQPAPGAPRAENLQQKPAPALVGNRNIATNNVANQPPAASQGYAGQPPQQYQPQQQPPLRTAVQAPLCATCGRVESVQAVQQAAPATGVGAVAGGVLGAVVGNQVGKCGRINTCPPHAPRRAVHAGKVLQRAWRCHRPRGSPCPAARRACPRRWAVRG